MRPLAVAAIFAVGILLGAGMFYLGWRFGGQTVGLTPPTNEVLVELRDIAFSPNNVTVDVGTKVTWVHRDAPGFIHTVTSDEVGGPLQSGNLSSGDRFSYLFVHEGVFKYHCTPHSGESEGVYTGMVASIVVRTRGVGAP